MSHPKAKKSLGQHFLHDRHISERIVQLLDINAQDKVIEIGPGPGALTNILKQYPLAHLLLIEKDNYFALEHTKTKSPYMDVLCMDALKMPWQDFNTDNKCKIISNLPYNVASPLMWDIFSQCTGLERAVFMMQKEVGQRIIAEPGTKAYGALSVWTQSFTLPQWGFVVGPKCFSPPPKVDSAVLAFKPLPLEERPKHPQLLAQIIKMCFQNRRKQLRAIFKQNNVLHYLEYLETLNIDILRRPETLSPMDFSNLVQLIASPSTPTVSPTFYPAYARHVP